MHAIYPKSAGDHDFKPEMAKNPKDQQERNEPEPKFCQEPNPKFRSLQEQNQNPNVMVLSRFFHWLKS